MWISDITIVTMAEMDKTISRKKAQNAQKHSSKGNCMRIFVFTFCDFCAFLRLKNIGYGRRPGCGLCGDDIFRMPKAYVYVDTTLG